MLKYTTCFAPPPLLRPSALSLETENPGSKSKSTSFRQIPSAHILTSSHILSYPLISPPKCLLSSYDQSSSPISTSLPELSASVLAFPSLQPFTSACTHQRVSIPGQLLYNHMGKMLRCR